MAPLFTYSIIEEEYWGLRKKAAYDIKIAAAAKLLIMITQTRFNKHLQI